MLILAVVFGLPLVVFVLRKMIMNPIWGVALVFFVNPIGPLLPDLGGLTIGRIVGILTMLIWLGHLVVNKRRFQKLARSRLLRNVWPFLAAIFMSALYWYPVNSGELALAGAFTFLLMGVLALMTENLIQEKKDIRILAFAMAIASCIACIPAFFFTFGIDLYTFFGAEAPTDLTAESARASTIGGNPNSLGIVARNGVFAGILLFISRSEKQNNLLTWVFLSVCLVGLVLSGSRTNFYGVAIVLFFLAFFGFRKLKAGFRKKLVLLSLGFMVLSIGAFQFVPDQVKARLFMGKGGDEYIAERASSRLDYTQNQQIQAIGFLDDYPLFGVGLNRTREESGGLGAHDTVSVIVGETGLLGFFTFTWLIVWGLLRSYKCIHLVLEPNIKLGLSLLFGMLVSFLVMGTGGGLIMPDDRTFWVVLGLIYPLWDLDLKKRKGGLQKPKRMPLKRKTDLVL